MYQISLKKMYIDNSNINSHMFGTLIYLVSNLQPISLIQCYSWTKIESTIHKKACILI